MKTACLHLAMAVLASCASGSGPKVESATPRARGDTAGLTILIDKVHANDFSEVGLQIDTYDYHTICGFRRGFDYLQSRGVRLVRKEQGRLRPADLAEVDLLFINLVSAEKEPFLVSEIFAIRDFVDKGGALLVITDHSNCYFHAHRLRPLLTELQIESPTATACDVAPHTLGSGNGWIAVTRFDPHPLTEGLTRIGIQTGGCVDRRFAVAWTSEAAWADAWHVGAYGEKNFPGCYGDFRQGQAEPLGPLGVVLAKQFGAGRIVVVADQNIFSDPFLHYADNVRLWLNSMAWLLRAPGLRDPAAYRGRQSPRIALVEPPDATAFGSDDDAGFYNAMALISRFYWAFADDDVPESAELLILAHDGYRLSPAQRAGIAAHLGRGKNVLLLSGSEQGLRREDGAVQQILGHLDLSATRTKQAPDRLVLELSSGAPPTRGEIHLLTSSPAPTNDSLPPPSVVPSVEGFRRNAQVLGAIRESLATAGESATTP